MLNQVKITIKSTRLLLIMLTLTFIVIKRDTPHALRIQLLRYDCMEISDLRLQ